MREEQNQKQVKGFLSSTAKTRTAMPTVTMLWPAHSSAQTSVVLGVKEADWCRIESELGVEGQLEQEGS
jgi:hypothetical protein